jgi:hypothetical protein
VDVDGSASYDFGDGVRLIPDLRDRFLRGVGGGTALGTFYDGTYLYVLQSTHCHNAGGCLTPTGEYIHQLQMQFFNTDSGSPAWSSSVVDVTSSSYTFGKVRPDNVGLRFCIKTP